MSRAAATTPSAYFETLYANDDPFGYRTRWYESRKRSLLLATLPQAWFGAIWELGCSNGELTDALAQRCDRLLATDLDARAVALAHARTSAHRHVHVERMQHPAQWPEDLFQLVVFSEVGYYFAADQLDQVIGGLGAALAADGTLVACHWLHPFEAAPLCGRRVHAALAGAFGAPLFRYEDADMLLEAWSPQACSVAQREALR